MVDDSRVNLNLLADQIVAALEQIKRRPAMYLGPTLNGASHYFAGFHSACIAIGLTPPLEMRHQAVRSRGWESGPQMGIPYIAASDLSEDQRVLELLEIELVLWKRYAESLSTPPETP